MMDAHWYRSLAVVLTLTALSTSTAVAQSPADKAVAQSIYKTINLGVNLYNSRDYYGCYRLYQGQAMTLMALTPTHPEVPALIEAGLARAETQNDWALRATVLRETLDDVFALVNGQTKPLWDRLGGEPAVKAVVHDFVLLAAADTKVDFTREGKYPIDAGGVAHLEKVLVELVSAVSGGPLKYTGRDMKSTHVGMAITNAQFDAIAGDLIAVLNKYKVPPKERDELVKAIAATRKDMVEPTSAPAPPTVKTLYDRLGGESGIALVVDDFVARAATDSDVNFTRKGTATEWVPTEENIARLKKMLIQLISQATGGPEKYQGKNMKVVHKGMHITKKEFAAIAADLKMTLDKYRVSTKDQEELMKIVGATAADIIETP